MIPRFRPRFSARELAGIAFDSSGDSLAQFETDFARRFGFRHAVWFAYGREAIRCSLEVLGEINAIPVEGRSAAVCAFNCVALGNGIVSAGWRPRYLDVSPDSFQVDPKAFLAATERSGVGIHVSPWGVVTDEKFLEKSTQPILHDRCLAGLADSRPHFSREADSAVYSFGWGKPIGFLHGGILCGDSDRFASAWRKWRDQRMTRRASALSEWKDALLLSVALNPLVLPTAMKAEGLSAFKRLSGRISEDRPTPPRDSDRWPSAGHLHALGGRFERLSTFQLEREAQVAAYFEGLKDLPGVTLPERRASLSHFPIRLHERDSARDVLLRHGIFASDRLFSRLLPDYPGLGGEAGGEWTNARRLTRTTLHLPLYPGLKTDTITLIARILREHHEASRS